MHVIISLYTLRDDAQGKSLYGLVLKAVDEGDKLKYITEVSKIVNTEPYKISLDEINDLLIKKKISERFEQFNILKSKMINQYKSFLELIKDYPILSKNSIHFQDCYKEGEKKGVIIGDNSYTEKFLMLNYELLCKKFKGEYGWITKENLDNYLINYFFEECHGIIPKYCFKVVNIDKKREIIIAGNYDRYHNKCIAIIYNFEDFNFITTKYKKQKLYLIPIRERITRYTGTSIFDWGYDYFNYAATKSRFCKEEDSKKGCLVIIEKDDENVDKIEKIIAKYVQKAKVKRFESLDLEKGYEDGNVVIYVVKSYH